MSGPTRANRRDIRARRKILTPEIQNCTHTSALQRNPDPMGKFMFFVTFKYRYLILSNTLILKDVPYDDFAKYIRRFSVDLALIVKIP